MPAIQSEELISFSNKLIEVDEKFCIPGKKNKNQKKIELINLSKNAQTKICCASEELGLISSANPVLYHSKCWLPTLQQY